jgi:hypothetical protein
MKLANLVEPARPVVPADVDAFLARYEAAQERDGKADLEEYLPEPGHPLRKAVLRELVRVELEYTWKQGQRRTVEHYRQTYPELFNDPDAVQQIAFEEFRQRQLSGDRPSPSEYQERYGINTSGWPQPTTRLEQPSDGKAHAGQVTAPTRMPVPQPDLQQVARSYQEFRQRNPDAAYGLLETWCASLADPRGRRIT